METYGIYVSIQQYSRNFVGKVADLELGHVRSHASLYWPAPLAQVVLANDIATV
jgi:hypothetical protein